MNPEGTPNAATLPQNRKAALTPRQQEILRLLCDGCSNKEIANRLSISLGTVKQHMAALFKRMNVRNRAMAVSQGMELVKPQTDTDQSQREVEDGIMRRPCVAMSVGLCNEPAEESARFLHKVLAGLAFDSKAFFLARARHSGDLVFGIKHHAENIMGSVLQTAMMLCDEVVRYDASLRDSIRIAVTAGMALVKRDRHGGESSADMVASPVVADARQLLSSTSSGQMQLSEQARVAMSGSGLCSSDSRDNQLPLANLASLFTSPHIPDNLPGRDQEWALIQDYLDSEDDRILLLEGETGMGKSALCQKALQQVRSSQRINTIYLRVLPIVPPALFYDQEHNRICSQPEVLERFDQSTQSGELIVVDDAHLLSKENGRLLMQRASEPPKRWVIFSGRRLEPSGNYLRIHLKRLSDAEVTLLLQPLAPEMDESLLRQTLELAGGIPLFATEMARQGNNHVPLSLMMMVTARLEGFRLDWKVLHVLAQGNKAMQIKTLCQQLNEPYSRVYSEIAVAAKAGILSLNGEGDEMWVAFHHPLVRRVVSVLGVDWGEAA